MKSILISIQPKWVEKIAKGEKTIEVRKTRPKIETPFKCYIYCTHGNPRENYCVGKRGKVIGEFTCDKVYELFPFGLGTGIELIGELVSPEIFCKESCLTEQEICNYIGEKDGYGWHISDLKVYDKPRELSEFTTPTDCKSLIAKSGLCDTCCLSAYFCSKKPKRITRPPQSWCYVEDLENVSR